MDAARRRRARHSGGGTALVPAFSLLFFLSAGVLLVCCVPGGALGGCATPSGNGRFWHLSDIHLDMQYNPFLNATSFCRTYPINSSRSLGAEAATAFSRGRRATSEAGLPPFPPGTQGYMFGQYGCDSPMSLFETMLVYMQQTESSPEFIVLTGDMSAHLQPSEQQMLWNIGNVTTGLRKYFPSTQLLPMLGNNDVFPDYYEPLGPLPVYAQLATLWEADGVLPADAAAQFNATGYYGVTLSPTLRVLALNTILYATFREPNTTAQMPADPNGQFAWLQSELAAAAAAKRQLLICGHIPPGSMLATPPLVVVWHDQYTQAFLQLVAPYIGTPTIAALLFGHLHRDEFRLLPAAGQLGPNASPMGAVLLTSSLTPLGLNNPSIRLYSTAQDASSCLVQLTDYEVHYSDLMLATLTQTMQWKRLYTWSQQYATAIAGSGAAGITLATLQAIVDSLLTVPGALAQFNVLWEAASSANLYYFFCTLAAVSQAQLDACNSPFPQSHGL